MTDSEERWSPRTRLFVIFGASALPWLVLLVVLLVLAACAQYPCAGGGCPSECQRDLSDLNFTIVDMPPEWLHAEGQRIRPGDAEHRVYGIANSKTQTIYMDETLHPEKYEAVLQHERCHILLGGWHA